MRSRIQSDPTISPIMPVFEVWSVVPTASDDPWADCVFLLIARLAATVAISKDRRVRIIIVPP